MWSLIDKKWQLMIVLAAGMLFIRSYDAAMAYFDQEPLNFARSITLAATFIGTGLGLLISLTWRWFWKVIPWLQGWAFPDLNGKWTGTLESTWINPASLQTGPPIDTTITIHQKFFSTSVILKTGESESVSDHVVLERFPDRKRFRIWYTYRNKPKAEVHNRSTQHDGLAYLEIDWAEDRNLLCGQYYTERKTTGDIEVRRAV